MNSPQFWSEFNQAHLNRVSRSFAWCIQELEEPLRQQVGLSYLICRIVDTVEDAPWPNEQLKSERVHPQSKVMMKLLEALKNKIDQTELVSVLGLIPKQIPEGEKMLLAEAETIFDQYWEMDFKARKCLQGPIETMILGMTEVQSFKISSILKLNNLKELNHYCFYVAGVVGEILTDLVHLQFPKTAGDIQKCKINAFHFGLFLQKINILKDQKSDEALGSFFIENFSETVNSLRTHAENAIEYILSLPKEVKSFKLFCSSSLALGFMSLPTFLNPEDLNFTNPTDLDFAIRKNLNPRSLSESISIPKFHKLTREQTLELFVGLKQLIFSDGELQIYLHQAQKLVFDSILGIKKNGIVSNSKMTSRFNPESLYRGEVTAQNLKVFFGT